MLLAPVLLTIGLSRAGLAAWWVAPVWLVAAAAYMSLETSKIGSLASFGPMMGVLAYLGVRATRSQRILEQHISPALGRPESLERQATPA